MSILFHFCTMFWKFLYLLLWTMISIVTMFFFRAANAFYSRKACAFYITAERLACLWVVHFKPLTFSLSLNFVSLICVLCQASILFSARSPSRYLATQPTLDGYVGYLFCRELEGYIDSPILFVTMAQSWEKASWMLRIQRSCFVCSLAPVSRE